MATTISAGTFTSEICVVCKGEGGVETATAAPSPHPSYTDGKNNTIVQLDMIVIGGPNGLNN